MPEFLPGLELSRAFNHELVAPIITARFADLRYSAALIGSGSDVLGYDTEVSTDHNWDPRVMLFLDRTDHLQLSLEISDLLSRQLPNRFRGYSTHFSAPNTDAGDIGTQVLRDLDASPVNHRAEISTIDDYVRSYLGLASDQELSAGDWLSIPQQKLLAFTSGGVFRDDLNLSAMRARLAYFPDEVWIYLLACAWSRIGQDEHLAPRAAMVGDHVGAAVIAGRIVRSIMQLCFLMARQYMPYAKWFGSAFARLPAAEALLPALRAIQIAPDEDRRQAALCRAYELLNRRFNDLGLTAPIQPALMPFHNRGFQVSAAWRYCEALMDLIGDDGLRRAANLALIGSVDQFSDNTDLREAIYLREKIAKLYD